MRPKKKPITTGDISVRLPLTEDQRYRLRVKAIRNRTTVVGILTDFLMEYIKDEPGLAPETQTDDPG